MELLCGGGLPLFVCELVFVLEPVVGGPAEDFALLGPQPPLFDCEVGGCCPFGGMLELTLFPKIYTHRLGLHLFDAYLILA